MYKAYMDTITQSVSLLNSDNRPLFTKSLPVPMTGGSKKQLLTEPKNAEFWQAVCKLAEQANRGSE